MEPRYLLAANPIDLGVVYVEQDGGSDLHGDLFELTWSGGADGSQLTSIVLDGDQNISGFGVGDVFFDTLSSGLGADDASQFELGAHDGIDEVLATVEDGGTRLVLDFVGFDANERLLFQIDVDEVEDYSETETDLEILNQGFDPITSGVEYQGSLVTAHFAAPRYFDLTGNGEFRNQYDKALAESGLQLPADDDGGQRDRTAAAFLLDLEQQPLPASIRGTVYHDRNNDGLQVTGEEGIPNALVSLVDENGVTVDVQLTDENGDYVFEGVAAGTYSIIETHPNEWTDGLDTAGTIDDQVVGAAVNPGDAIEQIVIDNGDDGIEYNFGEFLPAEINGRVQQSTRDGDCFDEFEEHLPIAGAIVQLLDSDGNVIDEAITDKNGEYAFTGLPPGKYGLREITPEEFIDGGSREGAIGGNSVGIVDPQGTIRDIQLGSDEVGDDFLFCEHLPAVIGGTVYHDANGNGVQDPGEEGIPGTEVQLRDENGNVIQTVITDENGDYQFSGVLPGNYMIVEIQPEGWLDGGDQVGEVNGVTSGELDGAGDKVNNIEIGWGDTGTNYDFGEVLPASIAGRVHMDIVLDCEFNPVDGEETLENVVIELIDAQGDVVATTTTDDAGRYDFEGVAPGTYSIRETQPGEYFDGAASPGSGSGTADTANEITGVTVGSGDQLIDYDFCETPAVMISGYVFQDGDTVELPFGESLPIRIADIRPGVRSGDDTSLPAVVFELRHGITGTALSVADYALEGYYPGGTISTTSNAAGYYEFTGIKPGTYAVYEQQPEGYIDGVDTPGTLDGVVFNPGEPTQQSVLQLLEVDPHNDGIVRITVGPGQQALENNFSEITVNELPEPITPPPITPPPTTPPPFTPPRTPTPPPFGPPVAFPNSQPSLSPPGPGSYNPQSSGAVAGTEKPRSWHLSVINGGQPRSINGATIEDSIWLASSRIYASGAVKQGQWLIPSGYGNGTSQFLFGLPGAIPFTGDFDGDGYDEVGVYAEGEWFIDINGNGEWDSNDLWAKLGNRKDHPVTGDWDGDGKCDIGIYGREWRGDAAAVAAEPGLPDEENRTHDEKKNVPPPPENATERQRLLRRGRSAKLRADVVDHTFRFGRRADYPVTGDWNGDGISTIGLFRDGDWTLDVDGDGRLSAADEKHGFGREGDLPLVGDFDGDGIDDLAVFRNGVVIIDTNGNGEVDSSDRRIQVGQPGDRPVVGDFDGDGIDEIVIYRPGAEPQSVIYEARRAG